MEVRHHLSTAVHLVLLTVLSTEMKYLLIRKSVGAANFSGQLHRCQVQNIRIENTPVMEVLNLSYGSI